MCMYDDGDGWKLYSSKMRRAAKEHRCDECGRTIAKGETYRFATGLSYDWDDWTTMHMCAQCREAARWLDQVCDGWMHDVIYEDLANHVTGDESYLRSRPLTRLVRWMRDDWRNRAGDLRSVDDVRQVVDEAIAAYQRQFTGATA